MHTFCMKVWLVTKDICSANFSGKQLCDIGPERYWPVIIGRYIKGDAFPRQLLLRLDYIGKALQCSFYSLGGAVAVNGWGLYGLYTNPNLATRPVSQQDMRNLFAQFVGTGRYEHIHRMSGVQSGSICVHNFTRMAMVNGQHLTKWLSPNSIWIQSVW